VIAHFRTLLCSSIYPSRCASSSQRSFIVTARLPSMPSLVLRFRTNLRHAPLATSFSALSITNTETALSTFESPMQSTESVQKTKLEESSELARLITDLNDGKLRQYARGVVFEDAALVYFTLDRHKDLRNYVHNMSEV
jgi:hypothetical protein